MRAKRTSASAGVAEAALLGGRHAADWDWLCSHYSAIVVCDFEFNGGIGLDPVDPSDNDGNLPNVICGVFLELRTGKRKRFWHGQFPTRPPFGTGPDTLWVGYMSSAEWGCFLTLGWPLPQHILDPFVEFKNLTNTTGVKEKGRPKIKGPNPLRPYGAGLLGAFATYNEDSEGRLVKEEKDCWRGLSLRGGPYTPQERKGLVGYCENDVQVLADLLLDILPDILRDGPVRELVFSRALLRGRYMAASARMERVRIPFDAPLFQRIKHNRETIRDVLIGKVDAAFGVYNGHELSRSKFTEYLIREKLRWPTINDAPCRRRGRHCRIGGCTHAHVPRPAQDRHGFDADAKGRVENRESLP